MFLRALLAFAALLCMPQAFAQNVSRLFATHYDGNISTLTLNSSDSTHTLTKTASLKACGVQPSWLTLGKHANKLYCSDESPEGTLSAFSVAADGTLTQTANVSTPGAGVSNVQYGGSDGIDYLAIAHYNGNLSTFKLPLDQSSKPLQTVQLNLTHPPTNDPCQAGSHPHQVTLDPTGQFIISPDYGADLIRVFAINQTSGALNPCSVQTVAAKSGSRHAAFWISKSTNNTSLRKRCANKTDENTSSTMMYLVSELSNDVTAFSASYPAGGCMSFKQTEKTPQFQPNGSVASEIRVKDDSLYVSNRNANLTAPLSDSITHYYITSNGSLSNDVVASSTGGFYPRTFVMNKAGDMVAVGNQLSATVIIFKRNTISGLLGDFLAVAVVGENSTLTELGGLSSVIWDESM